MTIENMERQILQILSEPNTQDLNSAVDMLAKVNLLTEKYKVISSDLGRLEVKKKFFKFKFFF